MLGSLYLITLALGGILLLVSLFGDLFGVDAIPDADTDVDAGGMNILTIRSATYFLFVFGATGAALDRFTELGALPVLAIATAAGAGMGTLVAHVFAYLRRSDTGAVDDDRSLHGLLGDVVIPISLRSGGKISVRRGAERLELLARAFDESDGDPATWKHVRIIDVQQGTALVSPSSTDPVELEPRSNGHDS